MWIGLVVYTMISAVLGFHVVRRSYVYTLRALSAVSLSAQLKLIDAVRVSTVAALQYALGSYFVQSTFSTFIYICTSLLCRRTTGFGAVRVYCI